MVSMESGLDGRNNKCDSVTTGRGMNVSMESGLDGRNNKGRNRKVELGSIMSQWSPA